jgi:hypothetical protein
MARYLSPAILLLAFSLLLLFRCFRFGAKQKTPG